MGSARQPAVIGGRFVLGDEIASGGQGSVHRAVDRETGRPVALKLLHAEQLDDGMMVERFVREAELLLRLAHGNLARGVACSSERGAYYLALELIEGRGLNLEIEARSEENRHFSLEDVAKILGELAAVLDYLHGHGVVHRDLKPSNVMLLPPDGEVTVKLLDLGIAKAPHPDLSDATTHGRLLGSLYYFAPEQVIGARVDRRADLFALGTILYELLTLRRAWMHDAQGRPARPGLDPAIKKRHNSHPDVMRRIRSGARPLPSVFRADLPAEVDEVMLKALAIDPRARFASARELASSFAGAVGLDAAQLDVAGAGGASSFGGEAETVAVDRRNAATLREWSSERETTDRTQMELTVAAPREDTGLTPVLPIALVGPGPDAETRAPPGRPRSSGREAVLSPAAVTATVTSPATSVLPQREPSRARSRAALAALAAAVAVAIGGGGYWLGRASGRAPSPAGRPGSAGPNAPAAPPSLRAVGAVPPQAAEREASREDDPASREVDPAAAPSAAAAARTDPPPARAPRPKISPASPASPTSPASPASPAVPAAVPERAPAAPASSLKRTLEALLAQPDERSVPELAAEIEQEASAELAPADRATLGRCLTQAKLMPRDRGIAQLHACVARLPAP